MKYDTNNNNIAVVVPLYKDDLDSCEIISLRQCIKVLSTHDIIIIAPHRLKNSSFFAFYKLHKVIFIDDKWLESIHSYNKLMLSQYFYKLFPNYDYILIYQLDAFVFSDRLIEFSKLGYDYIGAPWIDGCSVSRFVYRGTRVINRLFPFLNRHYLLFVGNGGFSLRRVSSCLSVIKKSRFNLLTWNRNEDAFWSYCGQKLSHFKIPSIEIAKDFALEQGIELSSVEKLPFGCHAWVKFNYKFIMQYLDK